MAIMPYASGRRNYINQVTKCGLGLVPNGVVTRADGKNYMYVLIMNDAIPPAPGGVRPMVLRHRISIGATTGI